MSDEAMRVSMRIGDGLETLIGALIGMEDEAEDANVTVNGAALDAIEFWQSPAGVRINLRSPP